MLDRRALVVGGLVLLGAHGARAQGSPATALGQPASGRSPHWGPPYTAQELRAAERKFGIRFPPDLFEFLLKRRFTSSPDWTTDEQDIRGLMALPLEGIQFDIYKNDFWAPYWGERPASLDERFARVEKLVKAAPTLIPLAPDMFIPESPHRRGNPIFFVFLSDVRYYAANIDGYVERLSTGKVRGPVTGPKRHIPFWTDLSEVRPRIPTAKP